MAEALVLPTWSDPWGLVVNEAMASGTPAIVSKVAGCAADLIVETEGERTGWTIPPHNPALLRDTMEELIRDPARSRDAGKYAAAHIGSYSPQACAQGMERLALKLRGEPADRFENLRGNS